MKIVCFADSHVNSAKYGRLDPETGLNSRTVQSLELMHTVVDHAARVHADALVFAGDAFRNASPPPTVADKVAQVFAKAAATGMQVVILDGNHDVSPQATQVSCLAMFSTLRVPNVLQTRFAESVDVVGADGERVRIATLPTYHTLADIRAAMDDLDASTPTVVVGHLTVRHAKLNEWTNAEKETDVPLETLVRPGVVAVVLGHLHEHQVLNEDPPVLYCGSTNRVDFGEEGQLKGFVELDIVDGKASTTFVPLEDAQRFITVEVVAEGTDATDQVVEALRAARVYDAVVRVKLTGTPETVLDERALLTEAEARGVSHLMKVQRVLTDAPAVTAEVSTSTSVYTAIDRYFADQPRAKERTALARTIAQQVDAVAGAD